MIPITGAGDGIRTRDIQLGKLTLYQLSYSRALDVSSFNDTSQAFKGIIYDAS